MVGSRIVTRSAHDKMLEWYGRPEVIAPFSSCEIHLQIFFERCLAGKPVIIDPMGLIQSVHRYFLVEMEKDYGISSEESHKRRKNQYHSGKGDHYLRAESSEELVEIVLDLYTDEKKRIELGHNALDWVSRYWEAKDRREKIIDCWRESSWKS